MPAAQTTNAAKKEPRTVRPVIREERCKGCGICAAFCPEKVLDLGERTNAFGYRVVEMTAEGCKGCMRCYLMCPDVVFSFQGKEESASCKSC